MASVNKHYHEELRLPGISALRHNQSLPAGLFLLVGPPGVGKTMYCRQFIIDGLEQNNLCIFLTPSLTQSQLDGLFSSVDPALKNNLKIMNPCNPSLSKRDNAARISGILRSIQRLILTNNLPKGKKHNLKSTRIVVDSLTHLLLLCGEKPLIKFVMDLSALMREKLVVAICTLAPSEERLHNTLGAFADGILEMKLEEETGGSLGRGIRLLSVKGIYHKPVWVNFKISDNGRLIFADEPSSIEQSCTLCGKVIKGTSFIDSNFAFDSLECMETYKKLSGAYGTNISEIGLPSEAFNVSFFFIDIVGLSNPSLSVKKQIQKIEVMNKFIASCDAFKKSSGKRIILPTGDGMAIGFLLNPSLPLELGIEMHRKLRSYNRDKHKDDQLRVRIGLGSGPVFTVTDMNNVQNVWGPGIILARRVMDVGDDGHILLADKIAEELIALKDEYRAIIKPVCDAYEIKHGQKIKLYSAYSNDFGNPELPARIPRIL